MDIPRLQVFLCVTRCLNFSQAAEEMHLSQPAVSRHIRLLEAELGTLLFQRLGSRVELTDTGRILADYAQQVTILTQDVRRVLSELAGLQRGYLRLGASTTPGLYLLPEAVAHFQKKHPGVEATLVITNSADILQRLRSGDLDLGFVGLQIETPGLQARPFANDAIVLIAPPGHRLNQQIPAPDFSPEMLAEETLIIREAGSGTRQIVEAHLAQSAVKPKRIVEMSGCEGVKRAVAAGLGVAFISKRAIEMELAQSCLKVPEIPALKIPRKLYVITRKDARPSASALAFLALVMKKEI